MSPSGYYVCNTQVIFSQSPVFSSSIELPLPVNVKKGVRHVVTALSDGASEITETNVLVTKFEISSYRQDALLLRIYQINDPEIPFRIIRISCVLFPYNPFVRIGSTT